MVKITITTTISPEDHAFCKKHNLKWSRLMENAISITRKLYEEGNDPELIKAYNSKIKRLEDTNKKFVNFLSAKNLNQEFSSFD